ncbi:hypothetical protein PENSOL_c010G03387 [Penicillium solitum]|uniref:Uncharacterized protein n=1 Tax=Penicillium solitum TaxID=60172 RepID=A0A1V6R918_9EURO|nr:uncharacterized protein PENSOL_c010G03387 [Penicillium solitum]OQD98028.1 hypothetical protein PENSOL_c010G03387 [Penicillium solitum]
MDLWTPLPNGFPWMKTPFVRMPSRDTVLLLVLAHITAVITIVRGWRALYRWGVRGWRWFCARHNRANAIDLDELAAEMRQIYLDGQYNARWGMVDWLDETTVQPDYFV